MALPYVVDSLETVAEPFRTEYTEKDGKFYLALEGADDHFVPRSDWQRINDESAQRRVQLAAWKKLGFDNPEKAGETLKNYKTLAEKAGEGNEILKQKQDEWEAERTALITEREASRQSERSAVVGERLVSALGKAGATEEGIELLPERLSNRIQFETVNGKRVLKIMKADGETPMAGSGEGGVATLEDLAKEAMKKFPSLFKSNSGGGGGKPPVENNGGGSGVTKRSELKTEREKAAFVSKHGLDAYRALAD